MMYDPIPLFITFKLALITTLILMVIGIPLAYWLAYTRFRYKFIVETLVSMPLVLPPTVLGFYLLLAFGPNTLLGQFLIKSLNIRLVFTFEGVVLGSIIYSLPFMVQPIQSGLAGLPTSLMEASYTLGKSKVQTLFRVLLPNIKPALLSGIVLTFAHTIGEFGVVLMIGGKIPGQTKVASIAIYEEVEALNYDVANFYSIILFSVTFTILLVVYFLNKKYLKSANKI